MLDAHDALLFSVSSQIHCVLNTNTLAPPHPPLSDMDMMVTELAAALPVNVLPGADDPANVSLPQQPLHACLFPGAAPYGSEFAFRGIYNE